MQERLAAFPPQACIVSTVTVFELLNGAEKARDPSAERMKVELFLSEVVGWPFDQQAAEAAGRVRADLERRGVKIGPYDVLIAGQALCAGLTLVTGNTQEFSRVPGLRLETWF